jgi:hypothetical protein
MAAQAVGAVPRNAPRLPDSSLIVVGFAGDISTWTMLIAAIA